MYFLSASIPDPKRDAKYFDTSDLVAIRDSVRALAAIVIPKSHLVWGGHPAITPLIRYALGNIDSFAQEHVTLYQSLFFDQAFPEVNKKIENIIKVQGGENKEESLRILRNTMFNDYKQQFTAGIFIGGMEGVETEFRQFREFNPEALLVPVASTGAAAKLIFDSLFEANYHLDLRLLNDYAYIDLFKSILKIE